VSDHQVGSLHVHLRTHGAPPAELATEARSFAEHLVEAIANQLDERTGGRLVFVRRLPLKLRAGRELLADRAELARMAADIAASITWRDDVPPWQQDVAVFADAIAWRAAYLVELACERGQEWCFEALANEPDGLAGLRDLPVGDVVEILARVWRADALPALLAYLPVSASRELARIVGASESVALGGAIPALAAHDSIAMIARLVARIATISGARDAPARAGTADRALQNDAAHTPIARHDCAPVAALHTQFAGLAYIVRCLLELDIGEILWRACVPEQAVIAAACTTLIGDRHDPAPEQLAGALARPGFQASPEQRDEIVRAACTSLAAALPRRGLAAVPPLELSFTDGRHGRVLWACLHGLPVFAAPALSPEDARHDVAALIAIWPHGDIVGPPVIAELDPALISVQSTNTLPALQLPDELDRNAALIVTVVAGCAAALFRTRAGELELAVRGTIHDENGARIFTMPMDSISLAVRRAGLDRDPGWVPWLERYVRIVFE
jgi:hypothetical protein